MSHPHHGLARASSLTQHGLMDTDIQSNFFLPLFYPHQCQEYAGTLTSVRGMHVPWPVSGVCRCPDQSQEYAGLYPSQCQGYVGTQCQGYAVSLAKSLFELGIELRTVVQGSVRVSVVRWAITSWHSILKRASSLIFIMPIYRDFRIAENVVYLHEDIQRDV